MVSNGPQCNSPFMVPNSLRWSHNLSQNHRRVNLELQIVEWDLLESGINSSCYQVSVPGAVLRKQMFQNKQRGAFMMWCFKYHLIIFACIKHTSWKVKYIFLNSMLSLSISGPKPRETRENKRYRRRCSRENRQEPSLLFDRIRSCKDAISRQNIVKGTTDPSVECFFF